MKKLLIIMGLVLFFANAKAQTTCATAVDFTSSSDGTTPVESQTSQIKWYKFIAENDSANITFLSFINGYNDKINNVALWSGTCGSLILVASDTAGVNDSIINLNNLSLIKNNTYYLQVNKGNNIDTSKYLKSINYILAGCTSCPALAITDPCNLICNGGFEYNTGLPWRDQQIDLACPWNQGSVLGTSDYYHTSGTGTANSPNTYFGTQLPRTGNGFAGFYAYGTGNYWIPGAHEYIYESLRCQLIQGVTYQLTFYVNLANNSNFSVSSIGACVLTNSTVLPFTGIGQFAIPAGSKTVMNLSGFITDKTGWVAITGTFIASGDETKILIGDFGSNTSSNVHLEIPIPQPQGNSNYFAYYNVDDVSLTPVNTMLISSSENNVCPYTEVTLTNSLNAFIEWSPAAYIDCQNSCDLTFGQFPSTTNVQGTITYCTGCTYTASTLVSIVTVTANAGSDVTICPGSSATLTASGGGTYLWNTGATTASILVNPLTSTTYTVTVKDASCQVTATDQVTVIVKPNPTVVVPSNSVYCPNDIVPLTSFISNPLGATYTWTNSNTAIGLASSGTGSVPQFTATNGTSSPITGTITVTPTKTGCVGTPSSYTITVNPKPVITVPASFSVCPNTSVSVTNFTSNVSGTTYTWANSNTAIGLAASGTGNVPSFTSSTSGSATITVTPTAGGCIGTPVSYTITITNLTVSATASPATINLYSSSNLSSTATPSSGATYSWSPTTGLNNSNIQNPIASPYTTTIYTVTASNGGCVATNVVTVTVTQPSQCGITMDYTIPDGANSSTYFPAGTRWDNQNIQINGTFNIDNEVTFGSCNFIMVANGITPAKIIIQNVGRLHLTEKTHIFSCTNMWDGILITSGGLLDMKAYVFIEDATKAVTSQNGAKFTIESCIFNRNFTGVEVEIYASAHPGTIANTVFTSRNIPSFANTNSNSDVGTIKGALTTYSGANLKSPNSNVKSINGINATDVNSIKIGLDALLTYYSSTNFDAVNVFDNLGCGINLTRTDATIYNNTFQYMANASQCIGCPEIIGIGIYANGTSTGTNSIVIGGTTNIYQLNTFTNLYTSIEANNYKNYTILKNTITNSSTLTGTLFGIGKYGMIIKPVDANTIDVENNNVTNCVTGIWLNRTASGINSVSTIIGYNTITANSNGFCSNGINIGDATNTGNTTPMDYIKIKNNSISETYNCIIATNVKNSLIIYSNPLIQLRNNGSTAAIGIKLSNCNNARVYDNTNINIYPVPSPVTSANTNIKGISVITSPNSEITCNNINNMGESILFTGLCGTSTLRNNTLTSGNRGLVLRSNGEIGTQGSSSLPCGLWWNTGGFTAQTYMDGTSNANTNSKLWVNNTGAPGSTVGIPTVNLNAANSTPYSTGLGGINTASGSPIVCSSTIVRSMSSTGNDEGLSLEELRELATDSSAYPVYEEENQYQKHKQAYGIINSDGSIISNEPVLQQFYDSTLLAPLGSLNEVDQAILDKNYYQANSINLNIVPANLIEDNQQKFNSIYLHLLNDETYEYNAQQKDELYTIALQCPLEGGNAVWQARVLIWNIENDLIEFPDNCDQVSKKFTIENKTKTNSEDFTIYPNPNNGSMILNYHLAENDNALLIMYDVTGKQMNQLILNSKTTSMNFNESSLKAGVYYYSIFINEKIIKTEKVVIIK